MGFGGRLRTTNDSIAPKLAIPNTPPEVKSENLNIFAQSLDIFT